MSLKRGPHQMLQLLRHLTPHSNFMDEDDVLENAELVRLGKLFALICPFTHLRSA